MLNKNEGRKGKHGSAASGSRIEGGKASSPSAYSRDSYGSGQRGGMVTPAMQSALPDSSNKKNRKGKKGSDPLAYETYARNNGSYSKKQRKKGGVGKKILIGVLVAILVSLVCSGVAVAMYINDLNSNMQVVDEKEAQEINDALAPVVSDEPFYMVLIGADNRGDETARSDTCILTRVDAKNATVTMISIPRDTAINLEGYGTQKFNAAYAYEGTSGTITAAGDLCGVKVSHYAEVHFKDLIKLIDKMGGVEVDVPIEIDDAKAGGHIDAGKQTLNGEQALIFARSRSYANGDFQRTTSQRILVEACINKLLAMDATKLPELVKDLSSCVQTDFNIIDLVSLAATMQGAEDGVKIYSALVPSSTAMVDGVSYVVCDTQGLSDMMALVDAGKDPSKAANDSTVTSSEEAEEQGITVIPKY